MYTCQYNKQIIIVIVITFYLIVCQSWLLLMPCVSPSIVVLSIHYYNNVDHFDIVYMMLQFYVT